jgi:hypothetical protein
MLDTWGEVKDAFPTEVRAEYLEKFRHPDTVHAICEEFRTAAHRAGASREFVLRAFSGGPSVALAGSRGRHWHLDPLASRLGAR